MALEEVYSIHVFNKFLQMDCTVLVIKKFFQNLVLTLEQRNDLEQLKK